MPEAMDWIKPVRVPERFKGPEASGKVPEAMVPKAIWPTLQLVPSVVTKTRLEVPMEVKPIPPLATPTTPKLAATMVPEMWVESSKGRAANLLIGRVPETCEVKSTKPKLAAAMVPDN